MELCLDMLNQFNFNSTFTRVFNFGQHVDLKMTTQLKCGATYMRVYTVLFNFVSEYGHVKIKQHLCIGRPLLCVFFALFLLFPLIETQKEGKIFKNVKFQKDDFDQQPTCKAPAFYTTF